MSPPTLLMTTTTLVVLVALWECVHRPFLVVTKFGTLELLAAMAGHMWYSPKTLDLLLHAVEAQIAIQGDIIEGGLE